MSKLEALNKLKTEYFEKLKRDGSEALKEAFTELFTKNPELESITWAQYTPYFNDGDACTFSVHGFDIELSENAPDEWHEALGEYDGGGYHYGETLSDYGDKIKKKAPKLSELQDAVSELAGELPDDLLQYIFGDHCQVTVTREGMETSEYEHD
jgi:hypothetical protein